MEPAINPGEPPRDLRVTPRVVLGLCVMTAGLALALDSLGLLASLGNRMLLRASLPSRAQIRFWDGLLVPVSRLLDPLSLGRLGKSIVAVWERDAEHR